MNESFIVLIGLIILFTGVAIYVSTENEYASSLSIIGLAIEMLGIGIGIGKVEQAEKEAKKQAGEKVNE